MKILLLFPKNYSLLDNFVNAFKINGLETKNIDFNDFFSSNEKKINKKLLRLPWKIKWKTLEKINTKVNNIYIKIFDEYKPDIVFIYNEQKITQETIKYFNSKAKTAFFLGDNPLFIKNRPDNLAAILEGQHIFSPDTYWLEQMKILGARNIHYLIPGYSTKLNYIKELSKSEKEKYGSDITFIGRQYHDTWGYKRALFINSFKNLDLKIYGDAIWQRWFKYFPDIEKKFILNESYLPFETVNTILNASKIYPVDANPGLINGLHIRIFDCIGSGILPLIEYRKDIDIVFKNIEIPIIKDYSKAEGLANYWLQNDELRLNKVKELKGFIDEQFFSKKVGKRILNYI